uniref:Chromo domain-containing protein n=1 Tax=Electrophorus electricus TaxID=8005 RepID=A0A4W4DZT5_ELEEL
MLCSCLPTRRLGQRVWLSAKDLPLRGYTRKLAPRYIGSFKVLCHVNPVSYRLALPLSLRVYPTLHVSRFRPLLCSVGPSDLPGPRMVDGAPAYMVKHLLDVQQVRGGVQYLVDWEGYGPEEWSWVPSRHIGTHSGFSAGSFGWPWDVGGRPFRGGVCKGWHQAEAPSPSIVHQGL